MRKSLVVSVAVVLVLAGGLIALLGPRHCPVNRAAFEQIEAGMTRAEVHAVLWGPPGNYRTRPSHPDYRCLPAGCMIVDETSMSAGREELWKGDDGCVGVAYSTDPVVDVTWFVEAPSYTPGLVELARWRLEKLWEAWLS